MCNDENAWIFSYLLFHLRYLLFPYLNFYMPLETTGLYAKSLEALKWFAQQRCSATATTLTMLLMMMMSVMLMTICWISHSLQLHSNHSTDYMTLTDMRILAWSASSAKQGPHEKGTPVHRVCWQVCHSHTQAIEGQTAVQYFDLWGTLNGMLQH